jgi:hypothetical protein
MVIAEFARRNRASTVIIIFILHRIVFRRPLSVKLLTVNRTFPRRESLVELKSRHGTRATLQKFNFLTGATHAPS